MACRRAHPACRRLGGGAYLWITLSDPYRTLTPIDVGTYLDNANSLRGNVYKLTGTIDSELAWSPGQGRLFSVLADGGKTMMFFHF